MSFLNSGYPQGISPGASSQAQLHAPQRRPQPGIFQPSQQHDMRFQYPHMPQDGRLQHHMGQQRFEQQNLQGYAGEYQNPTIQQSIPGQFGQQNWGHDSTFGRQQVVPEQSQINFGGYQQAPGHLSQLNYGSSSQTGHLSYQALPCHNLTQAFYGHPQILTQERQQPAIPVTGYENIDPALRGMGTNQASRPDASIMTLSQPPLTPRIAPQDFLHPFAYSGFQNGQDVSPLTIENPQFPVTLPPTPEVAHDAFEQRGQSTIPDPFAQRSVLTEQAQLGLGTDLYHYSGMSSFDQDTFDQALTLSSGAKDATFGHKNSSESIHSVLGIPDQRGNHNGNAEGSVTEQAGQNPFQSPNSIHTTVEETVAGTPSANQEPLPDVEHMDLDILDEVAASGELFELFPDLEYHFPRGCNFNYDGSMVGSGAIDPFENDLSKNSPEEHGPPEKWPCDNKSSLEAMEVLSRSLETEMAGPFLT
jgi:hypothetical protein